MADPRLIVERNVEATMRDGTVLRANIYRPEAKGRYPVLLQRTPYGKDGANVDFCMLSASRGYAVVVQDTRGRWASDGVHYPMRDEFDDGYDAVEWAAAQPWSNGKVGMWGGSYVGWTQWAAAATRPPSLRAIFPMVTFMDMYEMVRPGGALSLGVLVSWGLVAGASMAIQRLDAPAEVKRELLEELADALDGLATGETYRTTPLTDLPLVTREDLVGPAFLDWLRQEDRDAIWEGMNIHQRIGEIAVPAYHLGGWYDIFCGGTLRNYTDMVARAATEEARRGQKLIMGPWLHGPFNGYVGEFDFGFRASDASVLVYEIMWRWFDHWLKKEECAADDGRDSIMEEPPVRLFVMGRNRWRTENEWPLARTVYTPYYLHSQGAANTLDGNGTLSPIAPAAEDGAVLSADHFAYDPRHPVPTSGGGLCCHAASLPAGAFDQREIECRQDVLVYTSEVLESDLEVTGPLQVLLYVSTSAVDTDWTAKLVDVYPCGVARNLADGIARARYRLGTEQPSFAPPGEVYEIRIDLAATSNVFLAGHRLRLEISSSNFPRFERHPNTAQPVASEEEMVVAEQRVCHDALHPSHIVLPVIPPTASD